MKVLKPVELNAETFKDYGYVISEALDEPAAENNEFNYWSKVSQLKMSEVTSTGILTPHKRKMLVKCLERHLETPEVLVALEGDSVACFGRPSAPGSDAIEDVQAFYIKQGDAFAMHEGTWHWAPFPVDCDKCKFIVMFALGTEANDLEVKDLSEEIEIHI